MRTVFGTIYFTKKHLTKHINNIIYDDLFFSQQRMSKIKIKKKIKLNKTWSIPYIILSLKLLTFLFQYLIKWSTIVVSCLLDFLSLLKMILFTVLYLTVYPVFHLEFVEIVATDYCSYPTTTVWHLLLSCVCNGAVAMPEHLLLTTTKQMMLFANRFAKRMPFILNVNFNEKRFSFFFFFLISLKAEYFVCWDAIWKKKIFFSIIFLLKPLRDIDKWTN